MTSQNIESLLSNIGALLRSAGSRASATEIDRLSNFIREGNHANAEEALAELDTLIRDYKQRLRTKHVERLQAYEADEAKFKNVLNNMSADKEIDKEDMDAIAHAFIGGREKWKNRKAALAAIEDRFYEMAYQRSKLKIIENYKVG